MAWNDGTKPPPPVTLVSGDRVAVLAGLAHATARLQGGAAEVGVYKGGTLQVIAAAAPHRPVRAFDTFTGIPALGQGQGEHKPGDFGDTSLKAVQAALAAHKNISYHQGTFPDTTKPLAAQHPYMYNLCHFDGDLYQTCKDFIAYFWPRMVPGGVLVFDDYGWPQCPGVQRAIAEAGLQVGQIASYQAFAIKG